MVNRDFRQIWPKDIARSLDQDGSNRNERRPLVRIKIGDKPAHQAAIVGLADDVFVLLRSRFFLLVLRGLLFV